MRMTTAAAERDAIAETQASGSHERVGAEPQHMLMLFVYLPRAKLCTSLASSLGECAGHFCHQSQSQRCTLRVYIYAHIHVGVCITYVLECTFLHMHVYMCVCISMTACL